MGNLYDHAEDLSRKRERLRQLGCRPTEVILEGWVMPDGTHVSEPAALVWLAEREAGRKEGV